MNFATIPLEISSEVISHIKSDNY